MARVVRLKRCFVTAAARIGGGLNSRSMRSAMFKKPGKFPSSGGSSGRATGSGGVGTAATAGFGKGHFAPALTGAGKVCGVDLGLDRVAKVSTWLAWASRFVIAVKPNIASTVAGTDE